MGIRELLLETVICGQKKKPSVARKWSVHTFPDMLKDRFHIQYCLGDMVLTHEWQSRNGQREVRMTGAETKGVQRN